jgi:hypothetical protein
MLTAIIAVVVGMVLTGHLFIVGVVFLITIASVSRVVTRPMTGAMRVVTVSI